MQTKITIPDELKVGLRKYREELLEKVFQDLQVFDSHISHILECVDFLLGEG